MAYRSSWRNLAYQQSGKQHQHESVVARSEKKAINMAAAAASASGVSSATSTSALAPNNNLSINGGGENGVAYQW